MDKKPIVVLDCETTSLNKDAGDIIQLAAITIDSIRLEIVPGSEFNGLMKPLSPEHISDEALAVNKRTREEIEKFAHPKIVFDEFAQYMKALNPKKSPWTAPIVCGHNVNFDLGFINVLCQKYGYWDDKRNQQNLFNQFSIDTMQLGFAWFENNNDIKNMKLDTWREYLGMSKENAHEALQDVKDTASILIRFFKITSQFNGKD